MKNTKKILSITLTLCLMVAVLLPMTALPAQAVGGTWGGDTDTATAFAGGTGTEADPFQISNGAELAFLASSVNGGTDYNGQHFKLTGDIVLNEGALSDSSNEWTPIGTESKHFKGTFDGAWFEITGLYINTTTEAYQALFGYVGTGGTVKNVSVSGSVTGDSYTAGLVAWNEGGTITNCSFSGAVSGYTTIGGVVARNVAGTIANCTNSGSVFGRGTTGGIAGYSGASGTIYNCVNSATVTSNSYNVGGVVGQNSGNSTVSNCGNSATVTTTGAGGDVGGVVGWNESGSIILVYNSATVVDDGSSSTVGGVVGRITSGSKFHYGFWLSGGGGDATQAVGVIESDMFIAAIGSFSDATSTITLDTGDSTDDNLLASLNVAVKHENDNSAADAVKYQYWTTEDGVNNGYPIFDTSWHSFADGSGVDWTATSIEITTAQQLAHFASLVNGGDDFFGQIITLGGTINISAHEWKPIGTSESVNFNGTFDGAGHEITGLYIDSADTYVGLFGYVGADGVIKNLGVSGNVTSNGNSKNAGGVAGCLNGNIINCNSSVTVTAIGDGNHSNIGGMAGENKGTVTNSYNTGDIHSIGAGVSSGGIVGQNTGTVTNCYNTGNVIDTNTSNGGGVVGYIKGGSVTNSYFLKSDSVNTAINAVYGNGGTISNVGWFGSATSAIKGLTNAVGNIPTVNLFAALNAGVTGDSSKWTSKSDVNEGYPVQTMLTSWKLLVGNDELGKDEYGNYIDTILKPSENSGDASREYNFKFYDQLGIEMLPAPSATWTLVPQPGGSDTEVVLDGNDANSHRTVNVGFGATVDKKYTLTAVSTNPYISVSAIITVGEISFTLPSVTVKDKPTYGDTWGEIITFDGGSASVNGVDIPGTFSVVDAATVPDAGNNVIYSVVFNSSDTPQTYVDIPVTLTNSTVTIAPKTLSVSGFEATDRVYDGTTAVTLTGGTLSGFVNGDTVNDLTGFSMPERGLVATVDVGEGKAVSFADGALVTTNGNYTITAPTDITVDITIADIDAVSPTDLIAPANILANDARNESADLLKNYTNLPASVRVYSHNYINPNEYLDIIWSDAAETYDPQGGTYTYTGTLEPNSNFNNYTNNINIKVRVRPVTLTQITNTPTGGTYSVAQIEAMTDLSELGLTSDVTLDYDFIDNNTTFTPTWDSDLNDFKAAAALVTAEQDQTVTVTMTDDNFPAWATVTATMPTVSFTITDKQVIPSEDITFSIPAITYGETPTLAAAADSYTAVQMSYTYNDSETLPTDAGTYEIMVTAESETHKGTKTAQLVINKKTLTSSMIADIAAVTYNKMPHEPTATVTDGDLLDSTDYTIDYENNTDAGTAKVILTASATGNYIDADPKASKEFTIEKASIAGLEPIVIGTAEMGNVLSVSLPGVDPDEYQGQWFKGGEPPALGNNLIVHSALSNQEITVSVEAKESGNYTGTSEVSAPIRVAKVDIAVPTAGFLPVHETDNVATLDMIDVGDTWSALLPPDILAMGTTAWYREGEEAAIANTIDYTITDADLGKTLRYVFTMDADADYMGTLEGTLVVGKTLLDEDDLSITYDAVSEYNLTVGNTLTVEYTGLTLGTDYTVQWVRSDTPVSGATGAEYVLTHDDLGQQIAVLVTGMGDYTGVQADAIRTIVPIAPDAPQVTPTAGDGKVTLSWTVPFDGGAPITGYVIYVDGEIYGYATHLDTSYVVTGLTNGTEYEFVVAVETFSYSGLGAVESAPVTATPTAPTAPPSGGGGGGVATPDNTVDSEDPLTSDDFKELAESGDSLTVNGDDEIEAEFDTAALDAILDEAEGKTVEFIAKEADASDINDAQKIVVGDNLVLDLRVLVDGVEFTDFETGEVTISLPYTLAEGETAANLKVYYVDDEGKKTLIESSFVDGILTFKTNHFSLYMVSYEAMSFDDVMTGDWYYDAVLYAFENEIMTGTSDTTFAPNDNMTRAMVWTVLARMSGVDTDGGDPWYSVAQDWAVENEVSDGTNPDGNITREEFATMLYRYAGSPMVTAEFVLGEYSDYEQVSEWANLPMDWAVKASIISGMDDGTLSPQGEATRAQMATMLMRYLTAE